MEQENNPLGYKVCYTEKRKRKLKIHIVTNSYWLANFEKENCEKTIQYDRKTKKVIRYPTWYVLPVKTIKEFNKLWKGCPF